jgi:hypothetical protein
VYLTPKNISDFSRYIARENEDADPFVCEHCGREYSSLSVEELTVFKHYCPNEDCVGRIKDVCERIAVSNLARIKEITLSSCTLFSPEETGVWCSAIFFITAPGK